MYPSHFRCKISQFSSHLVIFLKSNFPQKPSHFSYWIIVFVVILGLWCFYCLQWNLSLKILKMTRFSFETQSFLLYFQSFQDFAVFIVPMEAFTENIKMTRFSLETQSFLLYFQSFQLFDYCISSHFMTLLFL